MRKNKIGPALMFLLAIASPSMAEAVKCEANTLEEYLACFPQFLESQGELTPAERVRKLCAGETVTECQNKLIAEARKRETLAKANEQMNEKMAPSTDPQTASALSDNLSSFLMTLGFDGVSTTDGNLNLDFNPIALGKRRNVAKISAGVTLRKPAVYQPLLEAIPEKQRMERKSELEEDLGDFDSTDFRVKLSLERRGGDDGTGFYLGRNIGLYQDLLSNSLADIDDDALAELDRFNQELDEFSADNGIQPCLQFPDAPGKETKGQCPGNKKVVIPEGLLDDLSRLLVRASSSYATGVKSLGAELSKRRHFALVDLAANQPQVQLQYTMKERDGATGPDEDQIKLTYEMGFHNLNSYLRWTRKLDKGKVKIDVESKSDEASREAEREAMKCKTNLEDGDPDYHCLVAYLDKKLGAEKSKTDEQISKLIKKAPRLAFSLERNETDEYAISVPLANDETLNFASEAIKKWVGSATFGKVLSLDSEGNDEARFDLELSYEEPSGEAMAMGTMGTDPTDMMDMRAQRRCVATATYSRVLPGPFTASFSAVWANKSEFLGEVDDKLSANFGLKWSVGKKEDKDNSK